jgi:tRNA (adenine22-N1)-methyltransferase
VNLGPRLEAIAARVLPGLPLADLCCDHAHLAAELLARGRVPRAIAGDLEPGPLEGAARELRELGLGDRVELRCGDGLAVLEPGEVGTVVLAGVGAPLAQRLLSAGAASGRLAGVRRVIVQANHGFPKLGDLRATIDALGWSIVDECLVRDQGRIYTILVAAPGPVGTIGLRDEVDREIGPILRHARDPLLPAWIEHERARVARALAGMKAGAVAAERRASYERFATLLDELARRVRARWG